MQDDDEQVMDARRDERIRNSEPAALRVTWTPLDFSPKNTGCYDTTLALEVPHGHHNGAEPCFQVYATKLAWTHILSWDYRKLILDVPQHADMLPAYYTWLHTTDLLSASADKYYELKKIYRTEMADGRVIALGDITDEHFYVRIE